MSMISFSQGLGLVGQYARKRVVVQIKAVALIISYLVLFQTLVLGLPLVEAAAIAGGIALVVLGLAFFMEGLTLGLMPLGEVIGLKLPQKANLATLVGFAFVLGIGATFAEPAIGVLRTAGESVKQSEAPLLYLLLNHYPQYLVNSVGVGVGMAVVFGMLRFMFNWSLKPFIYAAVLVCLSLSLYAYSDPVLSHMIGLAWDCGAVTTGPVTVPLVLALGIGINRVVGNADSGGFGVVTLASLCPIIAVLVLSIVLRHSDMKAPASTQEVAHTEQVETLGEQTRGSFLAAVQAIVPLTLLLMLVLMIVLKTKLPRGDEIFLGVGFAVFGMGVFNLGIELGIAKMGGQIGGNLSSSYKSIALEDRARDIPGFSLDLVHKARGADGKEVSYFMLPENKSFVAVPFDPAQFDAKSQTYRHIPHHGPLLGAKEGALAGIILVLLFAFLMGFGATLAEPALNTLGDTVEAMTVGAFKKQLLMNAVAVGVGVGLSFGVAKIVWDLPLFWLLAPPYLALLVMTHYSTEEFVNIAWDSAGVTTGPITVPLVLAMGLGIGKQSAVVEGFGILSMASVCPIVTVLSVGLYVTHKRNASRKDHASPESKPQSLKAA